MREQLALGKGVPVADGSDLLDDDSLGTHYEAGCTDASIGHRTDEFDREAPTRWGAIQQATRDVSGQRGEAPVEPADSPRACRRGGMLRNVQKAAAALCVWCLTAGLLAGAVSAHPGRTDSSGGHTCRTNCAKWGLSHGQYHRHGGFTPKPSPVVPRRPTAPAPRPTAAPVPAPAPPPTVAPVPAPAPPPTEPVTSAPPQQQDCEYRSGIVLGGFGIAIMAAWLLGRRCGRNAVREP